MPGIVLLTIGFGLDRNVDIHHRIWGKEGELVGVHLHVEARFQRLVGRGWQPGVVDIVVGLVQGVGSSKVLEDSHSAFRDLTNGRSLRQGSPLLVFDSCQILKIASRIRC